MKCFLAPKHYDSVTDPMSIDFRAFCTVRVPRKQVAGLPHYSSDVGNAVDAKFWLRRIQFRETQGFNRPTISTTKVV